MNETTHGLSIYLILYNAKMSFFRKETLSADVVHNITKYRTTA